jgi:hypothetical protein
MSMSIRPDAARTLGATDTSQVKVRSLTPKRREMVKRKSRAEIRTADGSGGVSRVEDLRFEGGEWPIRFEIDGESADQWLLCLGAECGKRGWQHSALKQMSEPRTAGRFL